jgi:hypothetical protein
MINKRLVASAIMAAVGAMPAPVEAISPLARVLNKYGRGAKGAKKQRNFKKPNKWDVIQSCGNVAVCRNRTTGEVATKRIKLGPCAQRELDIRKQWELNNVQ